MGKQLNKPYSGDHNNSFMPNPSGAGPLNLKKMKIAFIETRVFKNSSEVKPLERYQVGKGYNSAKTAYYDLAKDHNSVSFGPGVSGSIYAIKESGAMIHLFSLESRIGKTSLPLWEDAKQRIIESDSQKMKTKGIDFEYEI